VDLPGPRNFLLGVQQHLFPLRNPPGSPRNREQHREHSHWEAHRLINKAGIEIHVGVELAFHEIVVFKGNALALQGNFEQRVLAHELSYPGNFLNMLFRTTEPKYRPNPTLERALDVLFILHADHEQNCSANTIRGVGSSHVDPYSATAAAIAALYGPLHGGANEEVLHMLLQIGSVQKVPDFIKRVKAGEVKLMGFGHRVYKNYDPRARIIKHIAYEVFELMGKNPLLEIAVECERIALADDY